MSDNPAARLHVLLSAVHELEAGNVSVRSAWAKVLGTHPAAVALEIARVASLIPEIEREVGRVDEPHITRLFQHYSPQWLRAVLYIDQAWSQKSEGLVDPGALASLGGLAALLTAHGFQTTLPSDDRLDALRQEVADALAEVRHPDTPLPPDIRRLIVARLHDILWALDHLTVMGAEGVQAAAERFGASLATKGQGPETGGVVKKMWGVVGRVWAAVAFPGEAVDAIEGWDTMMRAITS